MSEEENKQEVFDTQDNQGGLDGKESKKEEYVKRGWPFLLIFFGFTIISIVFGILCIHGTEIAFIKDNKTLIMILTVILLCVICGLCVWFVLSGKDTLVKTSLSGYILIVFILALVFILQKTGFFEVVSSAESLQEYLEGAGVWMPIVYILLQYLQVVLLPIPSVVSTVAGVALFGPEWTIVYSLLGILPASATAFFVGRKLGNKAVAWMIGEDTLNKWQEKLKGKDNLLLTMMFILPMFPDDVLCFIAGLSSMSTKYFFIVITIARLIIITATSYSFNFIPLTEWWGIALWAVFIAVIVVVFVLAYRNLDKIQAWIKNFKARKNKDK